MTKKKAVCILNTIFTVMITGYVSFIAFLSSGWFIDYSQAVKMDNMDWAKMAISSTVIYSLGGLLVGAIIYAANRAVFVHILKDRISKFPQYLSVLSGVIIILAAIVGGITFYIDKPYMF